MADKVVIDHDILGYGNEHEKELLEQYGKILKVGIDQELPQRSFDDKVAVFCKKNNCDLLTADAKSYTWSYEAGIKTVQISRYGWWKGGDRPIYLVKFIA